MASRSRMSAAAVRSTSDFCSVMSTAMPIRCRPGSSGLANQFAARAQPDPLAARVMHAEFVVDRACLGVGELCGDLVEPDVVGMHQPADLAEGEQFLARRQAEDREHRLRPEDAAACQVPVPKPAASAIERRVDAASHGVVDGVGFARARRLPVEGEAEDQQHEAGGCRERDGQRGVRAPDRERIGAVLVHRKLAAAGAERAHRREAPARRRRA